MHGTEVLRETESSIGEANDHGEGEVRIRLTAARKPIILYDVSELTLPFNSGLKIKQKEFSFP